MLDIEYDCFRWTTVNDDILLKSMKKKSYLKTPPLSDLRNRLKCSRIFSNIYQTINYTDYYGVSDFKMYKKMYKKKQQLFQDIYRCLVGGGVFFRIFCCVREKNGQIEKKLSYKKGQVKLY